jgi:transglutaminase-like putative cysteine protease
MERRPRGRGVVAWGAAVLLWCAWSYCRDGNGLGLLWTTAVLAAVAAALPRPFPGNARWQIWTTLAVTVGCLAANVMRVAAPDEVWKQGYVIDRIATVVYAMGVSAMFFRMSAVGVTRIVVSVLPMMMLTIGRDGGLVRAPALAAHISIWVWVALAAGLDQARQAAEETGANGVSFGWKELAARCGWLAAMLAVAVALRVPVERAAAVAQRRILGLAYPPRDAPSGPRGPDLPLSLPLPGGFGERVRIVLLLQAREAPGYLRESVFTAYAGGRWLPPAPGAPIQPRAGNAGGARRAGEVYPLAAVPAGTANDRVRVEVLEPGLSVAFCLPGNAVTLACEGGGAPQADANGMVTAEGARPSRYEADTVARADARAYPAPEGSGDPAYLALPPALAGAVSNWTQACAGLPEAPTARAAARCLEDYFERNFRYRADVILQAEPDPLVDFMARREGFCVHFASAAALMLRARGIPARVVGGYGCDEWDGWLGRWVVREREAHAWVEAWDRGAGRWFLVEATPPDGRPAAYARPGPMRRARDRCAALWRRTIAALKSMSFLEVIAAAGEAVFNVAWRLVRGPGGVLLLAGGMGAVWWRRRARRRRETDEARLRAALTAAMCRIARRAVPGHLRRRDAEGWAAWLARVQPALPAEAFADLRDQVECYQRLRYRVRLDRAAAETWLAHAGRKHPPVRGTG